MDSKMIKPKALLKPLLLKDYLLDDFSSCSSNGFKSFPRKQCCTTVRFLIDIDLKNKQPKYSNFKKNPPPLLKNPSKSASSTALNSAFQCVINAVKHLPFAAVKSPAAEQKKLKKSILPRSLSKKILKKSFWKRTSHKEMERWKSLDQLVKEKSGQLDLSISSASDSNNSKTNSWSESDFTASDDSLPFSTEVTNDVVATRLPEKKVVAATNGDVSMDSNSTTSSETNASTYSTQTKENEWRNEEKEQLSPVSVLDCPFDDDDEVSSPFQHRLALMEGTKKKLMKKLERFEYLAQLKPVNLAKRFVGQDSDDNESVESTQHHYEETFISDIEEEKEAENQDEQNALELLHLTKCTMPSLCLKLKAETLLLDYFREKITNGCLHSEKKSVVNSFYDEIFDEARDWINGQPHELYLEWGVQKNRQAYLKDMEKGREWTTLDEQKQKVALDLEAEIYGSLINELLLDLKL
ncbi:hypothetical protein Fot_13239 [Forsythia ovata]|uniref:DUF4378 domain-containing protein n=1 Tax=Forsythia ovata TaxID=205694 RepID=A0ABD1W2W7_9LAMI